MVQIGRDWVGDAPLERSWLALSSAVCCWWCYRANAAASAAPLLLSPLLAAGTGSRGETRGQVVCARFCVLLRCF